MQIFVVFAILDPWYSNFYILIFIMHASVNYLFINRHVVCPLFRLAFPLFYGFSQKIGGLPEPITFTAFPNWKDGKKLQLRFLFTAIENRGVFRTTNRFISNFITMQHNFNLFWRVYYGLHTSLLFQFIFFIFLNPKRFHISLIRQLSFGRQIRNVAQTPFFKPWCSLCQFPKHIKHNL